jgi:hypothetical protein
VPQRNHSLNQGALMLTKDQWRSIETALSFQFGLAKLRCDGYDVSAQVHYFGPLRQKITVYVNGVIEGKWYRGETEEPKKFWRPSKRHLHAKAQREAYLKESRRRGMSAGLKKWYEEAARASITTWSSEWSTPASFCRNLRKTCTDVQIVKLGSMGEGY